MPELDDAIRQGLQRLTDADATTDPVTFERLAAQRRSRRTRRVATLAAIVVIGVATAGAVSLGANDPATDVAAGEDPTDPPATPPGRELTMQKALVIGNDDGATSRVVLEFNAPLPDAEVGYIDRIVAGLPTGSIHYTTQEPDAVRVCDSVHSFPAPAKGTVDLLIPAGWFADTENAHIGSLKEIREPPKFVDCGPHNGFFQYSIWGPASVDPADVAVSVSNDRRILIVDIGPQSQAPLPDGWQTVTFGLADFGVPGHWDIFPPCQDNPLSAEVVALSSCPEMAFDYSVGGARIAAITEDYEVPDDYLRLESDAGVEVFAPPRLPTPTEPNPPREPMFNTGVVVPSLSLYLMIADPENSGLAAAIVRTIAPAAHPQAGPSGVPPQDTVTEPTPGD